MESIYNKLKKACVDADTNFKQVCERAGVTRSTVERWKDEPPLSFKLLEKLETAIAEIKAENEGRKP